MRFNTDFVTAGDRVSPTRLMMFLFRPMMKTTPVSSMNARSPVSIQCPILSLLKRLRLSVLQVVFAHNGPPR